MDNINVNNNNNMKYRNVKFSFNEWYTWDEQRKTGYHCDDKNLLKMACFIKYKSYTASNNIPVVLRNVELV